MKKEEIIESIRTCSLIVGIICVLAAAVQALFVVPYELRTVAETGVGETKSILIGNTFSGIVNVIILLLAAAMFFRMARSGRPFTPKKISIVLVVAALMFLKAIIPALIFAFSAGSLLKGIAIFFTRSSLIEGMLFLFVALIMYYASKLQQESDETL